MAERPAIEARAKRVFAAFVASLALTLAACVIGPKPDEPSPADVTADGGGAGGDDSSFQLGDAASTDSSPVNTPSDAANSDANAGGASCDDAGCDAACGDGALDGEACPADAADAADASDAADAADATDATEDADAPADVQEGG